MKKALQVFVDQNDPNYTDELSLADVKRVSKAILKGDQDFAFMPPILPPSILEKFHRPYPQFIEINFKILCTAYLHFTATSRTSDLGGGSNNAFKGEMHYDTLFENMKSDEHDWFVFFEDDTNYVWPERCVGMLGTLATIHRNRGNLEKVHEILSLDEKVLNRYSQMVQNLAVDHNDKMKSCERGLRYKFFRIKANTWSHTFSDVYETDTSLLDCFKYLWEYERAYLPRDCDSSDYLYMLELIGLPWPSVGQIRYIDCE